MNENNLTPYDSKSVDKARENGRKGGIASGVTKRKKKSMAELIQIFMQTKVSSSEVKKKLLEMGIPEEECNNKAKMLMHMTNQAAKGNSKFMTMLMEYGRDNEELELKKKNIRLENERLKQEIEELKIRNAKLRAEIGEKSDSEDLTPLADLVRLRDDEYIEMVNHEQEQEQEVTEDADKHD